MFIQRLKIKVESKRNKTSKHFIRKLRYKHASNGMIPSNEPVTLNIFPLILAKSALVFGDFMVESLVKGKSIKKSMGGLEKCASKFGQKLYEEEKRKLSHSKSKEYNSKSGRDRLSKSGRDGRNEELSKTPSKNNGPEISEKSEKSKSEQSEKSKFDQLDMAQIKYQHSHSKSIKINE